MRKFITTLIVVLVLGFHIVSEAYTMYLYDSRIQSYWDLAVKASTLDQKAAFLDQFVDALEAANLHGNDALIWATPNNSAEQNMVALKSLQKRMQEIKGMDVTSFQYQQAISQITAQEQGEAQSMLSTLRGVWFKSNHFWLWGKIDALRWLLEIVVCGIILIIGYVKLPDHRL